jgi:hypothetical protein
LRVHTTNISTEEKCMIRLVSVWLLNSAR